MKHLLLLAALVAGGFLGNAQDSTISREPKKLEFGLGLGVATMTNNQAFGKTFSAGIHVQAEDHFSPYISGYVSAGYNLLFSTMGSGTAGFVPLQVGPRIYLAKNVFVGAGVGYGILFGGGMSVGGFSYNPHIGINTRNSKLILGYDAWSKNGVTDGFLDLKIVFRID